MEIKFWIKVKDLFNENAPSVEWDVSPSIQRTQPPPNTCNPTQLKVVNQGQHGRDPCIGRERLQLMTSKILIGPQDCSVLGTSLAVQWLRIHVSSARGAGLIPGWGTKIPHAAQCSQFFFFFN